MAVLIDSYATTNHDYDYPFGLGGREGQGQCIAITRPVVISSIKFYLKKAGSPNGNLWARIYAASGTPGTNGNKTGAVLASSAKVAASTLGTTYSLVEFTFTTPYVCAVGNYCFVLEQVDVVDFDAQDYPNLGYDTSSPSHAGNFLYADTLAGGWTAQASSDCVFELYGGYPVATQAMIL